MNQNSNVTLVAILAIGVVLGGLIYFAPAYVVKNEPPPVFPRLQAGGTSVVDIIILNRWRTAYRDEKGVLVDYESTGSTKGVADVLDRATAVGFTHAPLTPDQVTAAKSKGGEVAQVPVVVCGVVPVYNLEELKDKPPLKFTADALAGIFMGKITRWNDPVLKACNEGVDLPDKAITVVRRSDSSGTTLLFTQYLAAASEAWKKEFGEPTSLVKDWKVGIGKDRSRLLADHVEDNDGTIGYVDLVHTAGRGFQIGLVQNKDKTAFLRAEAKTMTAAAEAAGVKTITEPSWTLVQQPGEDSYPITGVVWAVCYRTQPAGEQARVTDFLHWVLHQGQPFAERTLYAPLSEALVQYGDEQLQALGASK